MKHLFTGLICCSCLIFACNNRHDYEIKSNEQYEKGKSSVEEIEKKNPVRFLQAKGTDKRNLIGQTVIKGTIFNSAKMVHFKDIQIKLSFFSKTGALLEEDQETVYETINPGGSANFKSKYFTPKGTDSIALKVISAKFE